MYVDGVVCDPVCRCVVLHDNFDLGVVTGHDLGEEREPSYLHVWLAVQALRRLQLTCEAVLGVHQGQPVRKYEKCNEYDEERDRAAHVTPAPRDQSRTPRAQRHGPPAPRGGAATRRGRGRALPPPATL